MEIPFKLYLFILYLINIIVQTYSQQSQKSYKELELEDYVSNKQIILKNNHL